MVTGRFPFHGGRPSALPAGALLPPPSVGLRAPGGPASQGSEWGGAATPHTQPWPPAGDTAGGACAAVLLQAQASRPLLALRPVREGDLGRTFLPRKGEKGWL